MFTISICENCRKYKCHLYLGMVRYVWGEGNGKSGSKWIIILTNNFTNEGETKEKNKGKGN